MAELSDGAIAVADKGNNAIRRVGREGRVSSILECVVLFISLPPLSLLLSVTTLLWRAQL